jgi:bifunctional non-homologous end joining protein LigD
LKAKPGTKKQPAVKPHQPAVHNRATEELSRSMPAAELKFISPMLAKTAASLPEGLLWQYEIKLDGYRTLVVKKNLDVTLFSRRGNRLNGRFPRIASAFQGLQSGTILDGEVVALDEQGRPQFSELQKARAQQPLYFYAFDLLAYQGRDLRKLPLSVRRRLLEDALTGLSDPIRMSPTFEYSAAEIVSGAREQGLEGVVAKRSDSVYEAGMRSGAWVKYKTARGQEVVVGGYLPGRYVFDSLLVGYYDERRLLFLGKLKDGFTPASRLEVARKFEGLATDKCPFSNLPERKNAGRATPLTTQAMKECRWLKPILVAQVEFAEWTAVNHLRHSRFIGLRDDKRAEDVRKEISIASG